MSIQQHIFLGALGAHGFAPLFTQLLEAPLTLYIIKGSAGSGKSTLLRRLERRLAERKQAHILVHCSSDADSLDGIICDGLGFAVIDGTAPHVVEPVYLSGRHRVISLYAYMDIDRLLPFEKEITDLQKENRKLLDAAARSVKSACAVYTQLEATARGCYDSQRCSAFFSSLAKRIIPDATGSCGTLREEFFGAVSNLGYINSFEQNSKAFENVIIINDSLGTAASEGIKLLASRARAAGHLVRLGRNPLSSDGGADSLAIDGLSLLICTNGFLGHCVDRGARIINAARFYCPQKVRENRNKINLYKKSCRLFVDEATQQLAAAKRVHDSIEAYFKNSIDFEKQTAETDALLSKIIG